MLETNNGAIGFDFVSQPQPLQVKRIPPVEEGAMTLTKVTLPGDSSASLSGLISIS